VWLSALFLVKEENAHGDLNEGETVKVRFEPSCSSDHLPRPHFSRPHFSRPHFSRSHSWQASVKVDYGPRKLVTLTFSYPSRVSSRHADSPLAQGTEV
jgi:hypothetical protein